MFSFYWRVLHKCLIVNTGWGKYFKLKNKSLLLIDLVLECVHKNIFAKVHFLLLCVNFTQKMSVSEKKKKLNFFYWYYRWRKKTRPEDKWIKHNFNFFSLGINYSWPLKSTGVMGANPCAVANPRIIFDFPKT